MIFFIRYSLEMFYFTYSFNLDVNLYKYKSRCMNTMFILCWEELPGSKMLAVVVYAWSEKLIVCSALKNMFILYHFPSPMDDLCWIFEEPYICKRELNNLMMWSIWILKNPVRNFGFWLAIFALYKVVKLLYSVGGNIG